MEHTIIDPTKLTRDYRTKPLGRYEDICKEDLEYLYLECNLTITDTAKFLNKCKDYVKARITQYDLVKTPEQKKLEKQRMVERQKDTSLQKYGVSNAMQNKDIKNKLKNTILEKYGVDNIQKNTQIRNKTKNTCLEKYGVDNAAKSSIVKDKTKRTCMQKYNSNSPLQNEQVKEKIKQTMIDKYGVEYALQNTQSLEKFKQTCMEKYGVDNPSKNEEVKNKSKQTNLIRYGADNIMKTEQGKNKLKASISNLDMSKIVCKRQQTCLDRYGCVNPSQCEEIKNKKKDTCELHYDVDNPMKSKEIVDRVQNTCIQKYGDSVLGRNSSLKPKIKQSLIDTYGVDNAMKNKDIANKVGQIQRKNKSIYIQRSLKKYGKEWPCQTLKIRDKISKGVINALPRIFHTKRVNGTFTTSKPEEQVYELLKSKFEHVERQYFDKNRYPYNCDFYIPELDLFLEFNGIWTHGREPFCENNPSHIEKLNRWVDKAKTSEFYENAIYVWTDLDVKKRQIALQNNLNFLEFFSFEEFQQWINSF